MNDKVSREDRFRELQQCLPEPGDVIECLDGIPASVRMEGDDEQQQLFTYAVIDREMSGWFLQLAAYGVIVFIDRKDHEKVIKDSTPDSEGRPTIEKVRILRKSWRGTSLIGELVE